MVTLVSNKPVSCVDTRECYDYEVMKFHQEEQDGSRDYFNHGDDLRPLRETGPWTLRFAKGDKVMCFLNDYWEPCIII